MTPLEIAKLREQNKACKDCGKSERVNGTLFCKVNGKMILQMFENIQICYGERLKEGE